MKLNQIVSLSESQIEAAAHVLAQVLYDDPLFVYMLPNAEERRQRLPAVFEPQVRFGHLYGEVFTTVGEPEGTAVWEAPPLLDAAA